MARPQVDMWLLYFDTDKSRAMASGPYDPYDDYSALWADADRLREAGFEDIDTLRSPVPPTLPPGRVLAPDALAASL